MRWNAIRWSALRWTAMAWAGVATLALAGAARADEEPQAKDATRVTYYLMLGGTQADAAARLAEKVRREVPEASVDLVDGALRIQGGRAAYERAMKVLDAERGQGPESIAIYDTHDLGLPEATWAEVLGTLGEATEHVTIQDGNLVVRGPATLHDRVRVFLDGKRRGPAPAEKDAKRARLEAQLAELEAALAHARAAGAEEKVAELSRRLDEVRRTREKLAGAGQAPRGAVVEEVEQEHARRIEAARRHFESLRGRLVGPGGEILRGRLDARLHEKLDERLREEGQRARQEQGPFKGAPGHAGLAKAAPGPLAGLRERMEHVRKAKKHLAEAGLPELAKQAEQALHRMERAAAEQAERAAAERAAAEQRERALDAYRRAAQAQPHPSTRAPDGEIQQVLRALREQVEQLRREVGELRERIK